MNQLPLPYPDECLYSVIARYSVIRGKFGRALNLELFGTLQHRVTVHLPMHLQLLQDRQIFITQLDEIVSRHTIYPYYAFFLSANDAETMYSAMLRGNTSPMVQVGMHSGLIPNNALLRCCPDCITADYKIYGEPYWHRSHQLPGSLVCHIHNVLLYSLCPECGVPLMDPRIPGYQVVPTHCFNLHLLVSQKNTDIRLFQLARCNHNVLLLNSRGRNPEEIHRRYFDSLGRKGHIGPHGVKSYLQLTKEIRQYFTDDFLRKLNVPVPNSRNLSRSQNWVVYLCRRNRGKNLSPLLHVLFMQFLSESAQAFLEQHKAYPIVPSHFGSGPWPCLNRVSPHYRQLVVTKLDTYTKNKKTYGQFTCDCGFSYVRQKDSDPYTYTGIREYGVVWEEKLKGLLANENLNLATIVGEMQSNFTTIQGFQRKFSGDYSFRERVSLDKRREKFLTVLRQNPGVSRNQLRQICPTIYQWLMKNDVDWLQAVLPPVRHRSGGSHSTAIRQIDWSQRDRRFATRITQDLRRTHLVQPKKRTKAYFERLLSVRLTQSMLSKLPYTRDLITAHLESKDDFAIHKVDWIISEMLKHGIEPKAYKVYERVGQGVSEHVKQYVLKRLARSLVGHNILVDSQSDQPAWKEVAASNE